MSVTLVRPAKTAEPIEMLFGVWNQVYYVGEQWRNLANSIEPSICGANAAYVYSHSEISLFCKHN